MHETSKATRRRIAEDNAGKFPWRDIFKGDICDVGSGDDPLNSLPWEYSSALFVDLPDGAGDNLQDQVKERKFDVVHGSQVLEHAIDPVVMLRSWIECLKPGGYIVATVPDFELYEKSTFPSKFNAGHRSTWTNRISDPKGLLPLHIRLPDWLKQFGCEIQLCHLVDTNYDYAAPSTVDQTFDASKGVECFHEFVLKRK